MEFFFVLILFTFAISVKCQHDFKVEYYTELIDNAFQQAANYTFPVDNSAYFENIDARDQIEDFGTFDFIVIGAGSSGSAVASRLSENAEFQVLLLEAGDWDDELTEIPYLGNILMFSERNWGYFTTPQKNGSYNWKNNKSLFFRGKVVGGSGSINGLAYVRGNEEDYNNWQTLGNPGWSFADVLPYFKKLENFEFHNIDLRYRGVAGPLDVSLKIPENDFFLISEAFSEIGIVKIEDFNAQRQVGGVSRIQSNIVHGKRASGATAYVRPASTRYNFNVTVRALVSEILIEKSTSTAYGVIFIKDSKIFRAIARKEVILSAGVINTPQLLMLSGIGPEEDLSRLSISTISNLPVGKQLKDHYLFDMSFEINRTVETVPLRQLIREYLNEKGILTTCEDKVSFSFFSTKNSTSLVPNVEIVSYFPTSFSYSLPTTSYSEGISLNSEIDPRRIVTFRIFLLHPMSTGTVEIPSNSIRDFPLIDVGIFENADDLEEFYEAIQLITRLSETNIAKTYDMKSMRFQMCKQYDYNSKEYWYCALKYLASAGLHTSSTAKMGPRNDPFAVVDERLHVYGINRLRVADCSVIPVTISGHTNAVAFMIGERAADFIKEDYSVKMKT